MFFGPTIWSGYSHTPDPTPQPSETPAPTTVPCPRCERESAPEHTQVTEGERSESVLGAFGQHTSRTVKAHHVKARCWFCELQWEETR